MMKKDYEADLLLSNKRRESQVERN